MHPACNSALARLTLRVKYLLPLMIAVTIAAANYIGRIDHCQDTRDSSCSTVCGLSFTYDQCRSTCNFCNEDCRDLSEYCNHIVSEACTTEDGKYHCRRFCGLCLPRVCSRTPFETSPFCELDHWSEVAPSLSCYDDTDTCLIRSCHDPATRARCRRFCGICRPVACGSHLGPNLTYETSPMCFNHTAYRNNPRYQ